MPMRLLALLAVVWVQAASSAAPPSVRVVLVNRSSWTIHEVHLASAGTRAWGPDRLHIEDIVEPGHRLGLGWVVCGRYAIRITDDVGDECVIDDVSLCEDTRHWILTDAQLAGCPRETVD